MSLKVGSDDGSNDDSGFKRTQMANVIPFNRKALKTVKLIDRLNLVISLGFHHKDIGPLCNSLMKLLT